MNLVEGGAQVPDNIINLRRTNHERWRYHHTIAARLAGHSAGWVDKQSMLQSCANHTISHAQFRGIRCLDRLIAHDFDTPKKPCAANIADNRVTRQLFLQLCSE